MEEPSPALRIQIMAGQSPFSYPLSQPSFHLLFSRSPFPGPGSTSGKSGTADPFSQTLYACQGEVLDISCPRDEVAGEERVIQIVRANFGRFSIAVCNDDVRSNLSVNCMAPRSLRILQKR